MKQLENKVFSKGIHNLLVDDIIPQEAASSSYNWITQDGRIKLIGGRQRVGVIGGSKQVPASLATIQSRDSSGSYVNTTLVGNNYLDIATITPTAKTYLTRIGVYIVDKGTGSLRIKVKRTSDNKEFAISAVSAPDGEGNSANLSQGGFVYFSVNCILEEGIEYTISVMGSASNDLLLKSQTSNTAGTISYVAQESIKSKTVSFISGGITKTFTTVDEGVLHNSVIDLDNSQYSFDVGDLYSASRYMERSIIFSSRNITNDYYNYLMNHGTGGYDIKLSDIGTELIIKVDTIFPAYNVKATGIQINPITRTYSVDYSLNGTDWINLGRNINYTGFEAIFNAQGNSVFYIKYYKHATDNAYTNYFNNNFKIVADIKTENQGEVGQINSLWAGYTTKGERVIYRKTADKLQYLNGTDWEDILTGLTDTEFSCSNYSSLAGAFTLFNGEDGFYLINNANPGSAIDIYNSAKNFKGFILVDRGRCLLWNRKEDKTGLYGSYIDKQNSTVYTAVSNEVIGALGTKTYTGTLAFKAGGSARNCFGLSITDTAETFTDNYDGTLTGSAGGVGVINYATGVYTVTFKNNTVAEVKGNYQWQDFTNKGLADFTKSATRLAGEGFQFPQDEGGDAILNVLVGQDGAYYSLKSQSCYRLDINETDNSATNIVYRKELGLSNWRSAFSTSNGIVFMNTANPDRPVLTIIRKNQFDNVEPYPLCAHFDFSEYDFSDASMDTYERYVVLACKTDGADKNDVILFINVVDQTVDIVKYEARVFAKDGIKLYVGSSISQDTYEILVGYDDEDSAIQNEWVSKAEDYGTTDLKKYRRLRFRGLIDADQRIEIYQDEDNSGFTKIGEIDGKADYVDYTSPQTIGSNFIGGQQLGGDDISNAYPFFCELRVKMSKFGERKLKFVAKGIGYAEISYQADWGINIFEGRLPKKYRVKRT